MPPDPNENQEQKVTRQALWYAGVIAYRRAFTSGRGHLVQSGSRIKINDEWRDAVFDADQLDAHKRIWTMSDRHIAHRVAEHEGAVVVANLTPPPLPRGVVNTLVLLNKYVGPPEELAEKLITMCDLLLAVIAAEVQRLGKLLHELLEKQDIEGLYASASVPGQQFPLHED
jgi:hypothetical protein